MGSINPFKINYKRSSENSLPALSAIYGSSLDKNKYHNRRNNSGLGMIDLSNNRKRSINFEKVYNTMGTKTYDKTNSSSFLLPSKMPKSLKDTLSNKKNPTYGKRNMSFGNQWTIDECKQKHDTAALLDLETKLNIFNRNKISKLEGIRNNRYKQYPIFDQKSKHASNRKRSSNSK